MQVFSMTNEELKLIAPLEPMTMKELGSDEATPVNIQENHKCHVNFKAFKCVSCVFSPLLIQ